MADNKETLHQWYKKELDRVAKNRKNIKDMEIKNDLLSLMVDEQAAEMNAEERKKFRKEKKKFEEKIKNLKLKRFKKHHKKWNEKTGKFDQVVKSGGKVYTNNTRRANYK